MSPELAERVRASVRGQRKRPAKARLAPGVVAVARFAGFLLLVSVAVSAVMMRRQNRAEREQARAKLLADVHAKSDALGPYERELTMRAEEAIVKQTLPYAGDVTSEELRAPNALSAALAKPIVYVRGPIGSMSNPKAIALSAAVSAKDSLVSCLLDPPKTRTEKAMLPRVRAAYSRDAAFEKATANVTRLADAEAGLPLLAPEWAARVTAAEDVYELDRLRRDLEKAPVERAMQAARSDLLLVALDEEGERTGPTELDGERPHKVRVALVDLRARKVLLRIQRTVDPRAFSDAERAIHASGLDSCALALDLRSLTTE